MSCELDRPSRSTQYQLGPPTCSAFAGRRDARLRIYNETVPVELGTRSTPQKDRAEPSQWIVDPMPRNDFWIPRSFVGAILLGMLFVGGGCEHRTRSGSPEGSASKEGPTPKHVSWDAQFTMSEGGRSRAVLKAPRMEQYRVGDSTYSVWRSMNDTARVRVYLFDEQGDSSATVTADSLVFQDQKGILDAYRNVVVVTKSNKRLNTEHLTWEQDDRKIRTKRFVRIRTPTEVVQGNGLVADEDLKTYQLGRFSAEVEVDDENGSSGDEN